MKTLPHSFNALASPLGFPPSTKVDPLPPASENSWTTSLSASLYKIDKWGPPYFAVNSSGNISILPHGSSTLPHQEIDLLNIVKHVTSPKSAGGLGMQLPLIVRLPDILKDRVDSLKSAFQHAIKSHGYDSHYQGIYPVKSNHDRFIVEDIVRFGFSSRFGLEAGSKAELLLAMTSLCEANPEAFLICNGYKDCEYINLALIARKLAFNTFIVLEKEEELDSIIDLSKKLCVRPVIGVRAKLRTKHSGHFSSTSGEKGKFGLTTTQILNVVRKLEQVRMLECLQLLHFHIGSQIPTTKWVSEGVKEATQIYCELSRLGAHMKVLDIGGGLGIDYDGSKSAHSDISVEYTLEEYTSTVVQTIQYICDLKSMKHPIICSESGRFIVSHHSILIFEVISSSTMNYNNTPTMSYTSLKHFVDGLSEEARVAYDNMCIGAVNGEHDTCMFYMEQLKQICIEQFKQGSFRIEHLADVDGLYELVHNNNHPQVRSYHVNLSVFSSIPDFIVIKQLFPIVPIHHLDEEPTQKGILSDLTCDCDGKIDMFIGDEASLPLHELITRKDDDGVGKYYVGMFLGGAYQEAIGGVHNLFGGPTVVRVVQNEDVSHGFEVTHVIPGSSCGEVLEVMKHKPQVMVERLKQRVQEFVKEENNNGDDGNVVSASEMATHIARSFNNITYLVLSSSSKS